MRPHSRETCCPVPDTARSKIPQTLLLDILGVQQQQPLPQQQHQVTALPTISFKEKDSAGLLFDIPPPPPSGNVSGCMTYLLAMSRLKSESYDKEWLYRNYVTSTE